MTTIKRRFLLSLAALGVGLAGTAQAQQKEVTFAHQDMLVPFRTVMESCADPRRTGGWINREFIAAYTRLHELGWAYSVEVVDPAPLTVALVALVELAGKGGQWLAPAAAVFIIGRIAHAFDLPFSRQFIEGSPAREVKASPDFIKLREEVLSIIFADEEEVE